MSVPYVKYFSVAKKKNFCFPFRGTNVSYGATEDKYPKYTEVSQCCPRTWREQQTVFLPPTTARALVNNVQTVILSSMYYVSINSTSKSTCIIVKGNFYQRKYFSLKSDLGQN